MNKQDAKLILERISQNFQRQAKTFYKIIVVNDRYDHAVNFFFHIQPWHHRIKSIPLHSIKGYDLEQLEKLIDVITDHVNFTIEYIGFENLKFPRSGRVIQNKRRADE